MAIAELGVNLVANTSQFNKTMNQVARDMRNTAKDFGNAGRAITAISAPITALGVLSVKSAINFESAFAGVRKTVDATDVEFAQLSDGIRAMSLRMPASVEEISRVAEAAGQLGVKTKDILGFTETMIKLGTATNLSSTEAADALARFANITGMSADNYSNLGSTIVALGNNFAGTESEIVEMGLRLAGVGEQAGLSEAEIMGLATALTSVGIEAEAGGTAFSAVMKKIIVAVEMGGKNLETFAGIAGQSADQFAESFNKRPAEAINRFVTGFLRIKQEGGSAIQTLGEAGMSGIRVSDALLRTANAGDLVANTLNVATKAWTDNTALSNEAAERYKTVASQITMAKNALVDLGIEVGTQFLPLIKDAIATIRDLTAWFKSVDPEILKVVVSISAISTGFGLALIGVGKFIAMLSTLVGGLKAGAEATKIFGMALTGGGGLLLGLGAVAVALIYYREEIGYAIGKTIEFFDTLVDRIPVLNQFMQSLGKTAEQQDALSASTKGLRDTTQKYLEKGGDAVALQSKLQSETDKARGAMKRLQDQGLQNTNMFKEQVAKVQSNQIVLGELNKKLDTTTTKTKAGTEVQKISNATTEESTKITKQFIQGMDKSTESVDKKKKKLTEAEKAEKKLTDQMLELKKAISNESEPAIEDFRKAVEELIKLNPDKSVEDLADQIAAAGQAALTAGASVSELKGEVEKVAGEQFDFWGSLFGKGDGTDIGAEMGKGIAQEIGTQLQSGLSTVFKGLLNGGSLRADIQQLGASIGSTVGLAAGTALGGPVGGAIGSALGEAVAGKAGEIISNIGKGREKNLEAAGLIMGGITGVGFAKAFNHAFENKSDPAANARESLTKLFNEAIEKAKELGFEMEKFTDFGRDSFDQFTNAAGEATTLVGEKFNTLSADAQAQFLNLGTALGAVFQIENLDSGQFGQLLAANFGMGVNTLNDLQIALVASGMTAEQAGKQIEQAFLAGDLSAKEFLSSQAAITDLFSAGIPGAVGDTTQAFSNFVKDGLKTGAQALDSLGDIGAEAMEKLDANGNQAIKSLDDLRRELLNSGHSIEDVDKFMGSLSSNGIDSLEELKNVTATQAAGIVSSLQDAGFGFQSVTDDIKTLKSELDKIKSKSIDIDVNVKYHTSGDRPPEGGEVVRSARGNVFNAGKVMKFAQGGIIDQPISFPLNNGIGMAGEAGRPEAIVPLKRDRSGTLGLNAEGLGSTEVINISIDARGAEIGAAEKIRRELENYFDRRNRDMGTRR